MLSMQKAKAPAEHVPPDTDVRALSCGQHHAPAEKQLAVGFAELGVSLDGFVARAGRAKAVGGDRPDDPALKKLKLEICRARRDEMRSPPPSAPDPAK